MLPRLRITKRNRRGVGHACFVRAQFGYGGETVARIHAGAPAVRSPTLTLRKAFSAAAPALAASVTFVTRAWYAVASAAVNLISMRPSEAMLLTELPPVRLVIT